MAPLDPPLCWIVKKIQCVPTFNSEVPCSFQAGNWPTIWPPWGRIPGYLQKHKPGRLAIPLLRTLEEAKLLRLLQLRSNLLRITLLQGSNSVSKSLGRRNIPSDEHAYIGINEHSYIKKCSDQKNQNSSPFTDCARSFAFWRGQKESVDSFFA